MVIKLSSFLFYTATTTNVDSTTVAEATTASTTDGDTTITDAQTQTSMYCNNYCICIQLALGANFIS